MLCACCVHTVLYQSMWCNMYARIICMYTLPLWLTTSNDTLHQPPNQPVTTLSTTRCNSHMHCDELYTTLHTVWGPHYTWETEDDGWGCLYGQPLISSRFRVCGRRMVIDWAMPRWHLGNVATKLFPFLQLCDEGCSHPVNVGTSYYLLTSFYSIDVWLDKGSTLLANTRNKGAGPWLWLIT